MTPKSILPIASSAGDELIVIKKEEEDVTMTPSPRFLLPVPADNTGRRKRGRDLTDEERAVKKAIREQKNREAASRSRQQRKNQQSILETMNATLLEEGDRLRKRLCTQEDMNRRLIQRLDSMTKEIDAFKNGMGVPMDILPPYAPPTPVSSSSSSPIITDDDMSPATLFSSSPEYATSPFTPSSTDECSSTPLADYLASLLTPPTTTDDTTTNTPSFADFTLLTDTDPIFPSTPSTKSLDDILLTVLSTNTPTAPTTTHKTTETSQAEPAAFDSPSLPRTRLVSSSPHLLPPTTLAALSHPASQTTLQQMQTMVLMAVVMMTARACRPEVWRVLVSVWCVCLWVVMGRVKVLGLEGCLPLTLLGRDLRAEWMRRLGIGGRLSMRVRRERGGERMREPSGGIASLRGLRKVFVGNQVNYNCVVALAAAMLIMRATSVLDGRFARRGGGEFSQFGTLGKGPFMHGISRKDMKSWMT